MDFIETGMRRSRKWDFFVLMALLILAGCGGGDNKGKNADNPTSGKIRIGVDDSYSLMIDAQLYTFHALYRYAEIDTFCRPEADVINAFMADSLPLMIISRQLTQEEDAALKLRQIYPKSTKLAYDAVALILNRENPDTNLLYDRVRDLFTGKITTWKEISPASKLGKVKIIFDNNKSANARYFRERFGVDRLPDICYAAQNNAEVIRLVEKDRNAIGVISVNWVSDPQDTVSHGFLTRIRVAAISSPGSNDPGGDFYTPHPGYIAESFYPFTREVWSINRQPYVGLAYGISAFIAGEKGQMIVLHSGLVPAAMPVRIVEIRN